MTLRILIRSLILVTVALAAVPLVGCAAPQSEAEMARRQRLAAIWQQSMQRPAPIYSPSTAPQRVVICGGRADSSRYGC